MFQSIFFHFYVIFCLFSFYSMPLARLEFRFTDIDMGSLWILNLLFVLLLFMLKAFSFILVHLNLTNSFLTYSSLLTCVS